MHKPTMTQTLKRAGYLLVILCGIGAAFLALLLLINLPVFDEELHPDLAALPQIDTPPPAEGNAYYGLMGLGAAPDRDFIAAGQALVQLYLRNRSDGTDTLTAADFEEALGSDFLDVRFRTPGNCEPLAPLCSLEQLVTALRQGTYDRAHMNLALQRYDTLLALPTLQYLGATTVNSPAPNYRMPRETQSYALATRYATGSSTVFLNHVAADLEFWKLLLREGRWILDKMLANAALWTDLQALSDYLASHELSPQERALIDSMLEPLNAEELDIAEAFIVEAQDLQRFLQDGRAQLSYFDMSHPWHIVGNLRLPLTLPNATANRRYVGILKPLAELSGLSAAAYASTVNSPAYRERRAGPRLGFSPHNLYNLGGKLMLGAQSWSSGHTYIGRMHDLSAMLLAVRLQLQLEGAAREQLPELIRSSNIRQPYNDAAFDYDAASGILSFECSDDWLQSHQRCRINL